MRTNAVLILTICTAWSTEVTSVSTSSYSTTSKPDVASTVNEFGYNLMLKMMNENNDKNIVISPTGIAGLLAMILLGSVGNTYDEIANSLGFSQDMLLNRETHENLGALLKDLNTNVSSKTLYADAIFMHRTSHVRDIYKQYLHKVYDGETIGTDFTQAEEAKTFINEWVKSHTGGQIDDFIKMSIPTSTKLILLSALYFRGQWKKPFVPEYTTKMKFKKTTEKVLADFMFNYGQFDYIFSEINDLHMIALPYNDSTNTMYALKPRVPARLSLSGLMSRLNYTKIDNIINQMSKKNCIIRFPKMKLENGASLENALKSMGLKSMFNPGEANFALMLDSNTVDNQKDEELIARIRSNAVEGRNFMDLVQSLPNPGIYVDSVMHDVRMDINEYGTEAVAASAAVLSRSSEQFYADTPFYIFIRNEKTKLVTFSAVIYDPIVSTA